MRPLLCPHKPQPEGEDLEPQTCFLRSGLHGPDGPKGLGKRMVGALQPHSEKRLQFQRVVRNVLGNQSKGKQPSCLYLAPASCVTEHCDWKSVNSMELGPYEKVGWTVVPQHCDLKAQMAEERQVAVGQETLEAGPSNLWLGWPPPALAPGTLLRCLPTLSRYYKGDTREPCESKHTSCTEPSVPLGVLFLRGLLEKFLNPYEIIRAASYTSYRCYKCSLPPVPLTRISPCTCNPLYTS